MRIVVFGASSGIGRELVLHARTGGHHAVIRRPFAIA